MGQQPFSCRDQNVCLNISVADPSIAVYSIQTGKCISKDSLIENKMCRSAHDHLAYVLETQVSCGTKMKPTQHKF